jgi:hypothetical protein
MNHKGTRIQFLAGIFLQSIQINSWLLHQSVQQLYPWEQSNQDDTLNSHLHLVLTLRIRHSWHIPV